MEQSDKLDKSLRQRAEKKNDMNGVNDLKVLTPDETLHLLHDLQVHQIELEMQNEELRRTQDELTDARTRYFELYDLAPVGYITINSNGLIQEANLTSTTMLGMTRSQILHCTMSQLVFTEDQDNYFLYRKKILQSYELRSTEIRMIRSDRSVFWANMQAIPASDGKCFITFTDISERKRAEESVRLFEEQIHQNQKLESLGLLAGGVAHDFNNILGIIMGNCSLAKLHPEKASIHIQPIENAAERAADLCRQMLAYAGKSTFVMSLFRMDDLVDEMVKMLRVTIDQNVVINTCFVDSNSEIKADAGQIRQIVMNLIINAAEAIGDAQGVIQLSLRKVAFSKEHSEADHLGKLIPAGRYICLEVTDNGCGMTQEIRNRVFEPFYTTKFTGRGLGMSAVLGIISSHNGSLQLTSKPGVGTTFKVYLPVYGDRSEVVDSPALVPSDSWCGSGTVLLVEDENQLRIVVKNMLNKIGFTVIEAANGIEALSLYYENKAVINLVLTDLGMPMMDGYQLLGALKKLDPGLPVIISSGFVDNVVTERIANEHVAGVVSKPYQFEQLREILKNAVLSRNA